MQTMNRRRGYRLSWPIVAIIAAAFATLFSLGVTNPQAWVFAIILVPLALAPV